MYKLFLNCSTHIVNFFINPLKKCVAHYSTLRSQKSSPSFRIGDHLTLAKVIWDAGVVRVFVKKTQNVRKK
jgi:hypothetical protein